MSAVAGVLAFAGAVALLMLPARTKLDGDSAPPLTVVSPGLRVRLIAIDGFNPVVFDELAQEGRVPALAAVFRSAHARLAAETIRDPARVWTTIATGQTPDVHGVQGLETRRVAGLQGSLQAGEPSRLGDALQAATDPFRLTRPGIASRHERREKTIWEVASDAGLRTVVVNWWATWPADAGGNIILSDRATLRLEHGGPLDAEIAPASVYERLEPRWPAIRKEAAAHVAQTLPLPDDAVYARCCSGPRSWMRCSSRSGVRFPRRRPICSSSISRGSTSRSTGSWTTRMRRAPSARGSRFASTTCFSIGCSPDRSRLPPAKRSSW